TTATTRNCNAMTFRVAPRSRYAAIEAAID
ncbi:hypothetical protein A2U01_0043057, partial [Trifolium medium]|nr:hypothetical protein [Trifolium medium]